MELAGRIIAILEAKSGTSSKTGNPWMMQGYVIEVPGQYPRHCAFTVFGEDRIKQLNIQNGEDLTVQFDIDAREYNGRWYNDFRAYHVIRGNVASQPVSTITTPVNENLTPFPPMSENSESFNSDDGNDLPF